MNHVDAIVFDVDGTLADTEETHRQAFNRAFEEFDLDWEWTPALYGDLLAVSGGRERIAYYGRDLAARFAHDDEFNRYVREVHRVKTRVYADMVTAGRVPLRTGIRRVIDDARDAGIKLAIATSSAFSNLKTLLDNNLSSDWINWFSSIQTCDSVEQKKPSPAVYVAVLEELGVAPDRTIAFEDSENGLRSAVAAGLTTVITTHFFTRNDHFPNAALVVDSLGEPHRPFTVRHGDAKGHHYVNLELLDRLIEARALLEDDEIVDKARALTA